MASESQHTKTEQLVRINDNPLYVITDNQIPLSYVSNLDSAKEIIRLMIDEELRIAKEDSDKWFRFKTEISENGQTAKLFRQQTGLIFDGDYILIEKLEIHTVHNAQLVKRESTFVDSPATQSVFMNTGECQTYTEWEN